MAVVSGRLPLIASKQRTLPSPLTVRAREGCEVVCDEGRFIDFTSWDLFGLASHPRILGAAHAALEQFGVSGSSAFLRSGCSQMHASLSGLIARELGAEDAIIFPSRSQAVFSVFASGVISRDLAVTVDPSCSSPVHDAASLAHVAVMDGGGLVVPKHSQVTENTQLQREPLYWIEPVSKVGRHSAKLLKELEKSAIPLIVDEGASLGVTGIDGKGHFPPPLLSQRPFLRLVSFEALVGCTLCAVVGSLGVVEVIRDSSNHLARELAVSPVEVAAVHEGLAMLSSTGGLRDELGVKSAACLESLARHGASVVSSEAYPIIGIQCATNSQARELVIAMRARGYLLDFVGADRPGSPSAIVRAILRSCHSLETVETFVGDLCSAQRLVK